MLRGFGLQLLDLCEDLHLDLLWFGLGGELGVCYLGWRCDIIMGLLVLDEGEADVQRADVEDDCHGDVEETQQYH